MAGPRLLGRAVGLVALILAASTEAQAQNVLELADGRSAVIPVQQGFLGIDFKESSIGTHLYKEFTQASGTWDVCGRTVPAIPNHDEVTANVAFSAEKGKRALFAKGQFTPGLDVEAGFTRFWELGPRIGPSDCGSDPNAIDTRGRGYHALYLAIHQSVASRDTVELPAGAPVAIGAETERSTSVIAAYNRDFGHTRIIGLSANIGREWRSPGDASPQQVCVTTAEGVSADARNVSVSDCSDRYVGPLHDFTTARLRVDYAAKLRPLAWRDQIQVGVLTSASTVIRSGRNAVYNIAVGPTLHPKGKPSQLYGALLIEARDLSNANGDHPEAKDRWSARLYAALPF